MGTVDAEMKVGPADRALCCQCRGKPGVAQNKALDVLSTVRESAFPISGFPLDSASFVPIEHDVGYRARRK